MSKLYVDQIFPNSSLQVTVGNAGNFLGSSVVGEIKYLRQRRSPSASFPYWNLQNPSGILNTSNYPDYVEYLRSIVSEVPFTGTLLPTTSGTPSNTATISFSSGYSANTDHIGRWIAICNSSAPSLADRENYQFRMIVASANNSITVDVPFSMSSSYTVWLLDHNSVTDTFTGVATNNNSLVLSDSIMNRVLFSCLLEDYAFGFRGENTATDLSSQWGMVISICDGATWTESLASERIITGFSASTNANRTITFSGSPLNGTESFRIFPNRIVGSTSTARHRQVLDVHLGVGGLEVVSGLRRRDRMQGHRHTHSFTGAGSPITYLNPPTTATLVDIVQNNTSTPTSDTANGSPRTDQFNQPRTLGVYAYEFVGRVFS